MHNHILVVDDDAGILEAIEGVLDLEGYLVEVAHDGVEALHKVKLNSPSLILLDIMMPQLDGFAVAADLERQGLRSTIPLIVLTADGNAAAKAARIGAAGYVTKPFTLDGLLQEVNRVIGPAR